MSEPANNERRLERERDHAREEADKWAGIAFWLGLAAAALLLFWLAGTHNPLF